MKDHAVGQGYTITVARSKKNKGVVVKYWLRCDCGALYNRQRVKGTRKRDGHRLQSLNCPFLCISTHTPHGYMVRVEHGQHNYDPLTAVTMPSIRKCALTAAIRKEIKSQLRARIRPQQIITYLRIQHPDIPIKEQDIYNYKQKKRQENLGGKTPLHALANKLFDDDSDYSNYLLNEDQKIIGLFWAPKDCIDILDANPDSNL